MALCCCFKKPLHFLSLSVTDMNKNHVSEKAWSWRPWCSFATVVLSKGQQVLSAGWWAFLSRLYPTNAAETLCHQRLFHQREIPLRPLWMGLPLLCIAKSIAKWPDGTREPGFKILVRKPISSSPSIPYSAAGTGKTLCSQCWTLVSVLTAPPSIPIHPTPRASCSGCRCVLSSDSEYLLLRDLYSRGVRFVLLSLSFFLVYLVFNLAESSVEAALPLLHYYSIVFPLMKSLAVCCSVTDVLALVESPPLGLLSVLLMFAVLHYNR